MSRREPGVPETTNRAVPSKGQDPRETAAESTAPPGKTWFRDLDEAVIESDRCTQCGTCVAACPADSIGIDSEMERPTLVKMCTGCSRCWDYCPRSGMRYERLVEDVQSSIPDDVGGTYSAQAVDAATADAGQDGGAVTTLLAQLLEAGEIDGAIVATEGDEPLHGEAFLATSREELVDNAGSFYNQTMQVGRIEELLDAAGLDDPDLAVVGTPCVIEGATALAEYGYDGELDEIALTVSLMCTRAFESRRLRDAIAELGVEPAAVEKLDVDGGTLFGYDADGETLFDEDVDEFGRAGLDGCDECTDFVGAAADITAGSVGSGDGKTTLIARTERGERAVEQAGDALELGDLEQEPVLDKVGSWNEKRARSIMPREYDPEGGLDISHRDHYEAYDGTDREPRPLNPARVHQYEEWC
jgi:coenzyme F420 hydrogenase subunit beta